MRCADAAPLPRSRSVIGFVSRLSGQGFAWFLLSAVPANRLCPASPGLGFGGVEAAGSWGLALACTDAALLSPSLSVTGFASRRSGWVSGCSARSGACFSWGCPASRLDRSARFRLPGFGPCRGFRTGLVSGFRSGCRFRGVRRFPGDPGSPVRGRPGLAGSGPGRARRFGTGPGLLTPGPC